MNKTKTLTLYLDGFAPEEIAEKSDIKLSVEDTKISISGIPEGNSLTTLLKSDVGKYYVGFKPDKKGNLEFNYELHIGGKDSFVRAEDVSIMGTRGYTTIIFYTLNNKKGRITLGSSLHGPAISTDEYDGKTTFVKNLLDSYTLSK